jgi:hypothetical protein
MNAVVSKVGNYFCHALSVSGCEQNHVVQAIGYAALLIPPVTFFLIIMQRGR